MGMSKEEKAVQDIVNGAMSNDVAQIASGVAHLVGEPLGGMITSFITQFTARQGHSLGPYIVLGLMPSAPDEVVDAAYRAMAKKYHSDKGGSDQEMARINKAYEQIKEQRRGSPTV